MASRQYEESSRQGQNSCMRCRFDSDPGDSKEKQTKCGQNVTYFAESTSIPGLHKIWASPLIPLKVIWSLLFIAATVVVVMQLVELFKTFYSRPIKTSVKLGFSPLPFPAVTICNANPIKLSRAYQLSCDLQKTLEIDAANMSAECLNHNYTVDYDETETELVCDENDYCYEEEVSGLDKYYLRTNIIADELAQESIDVRKQVGHDIDDMLMECSLNGRSCGPENFTQFLSKDLGNCYTFDSKGIQSKKSGPITGLSMVLNLEPEEFIDTFKTGYGLRVVVHERGTRAFPSSQGFTVSAGSESSITMKLVDITRMGQPHGFCNESTSFKKNFGIEYTEMACRELCQTNLVIQKCNCIGDYDISVSGNVQICETEAEWDCEWSTLNKYYVDTSKGLDVCKCNSPCSEKSYETSVTSRSWPVLSHVETLEKQVCKTNPDSVKCTYTAYDFENVNMRLYSFLKLKVYFESLNFEKVVEEPFYTTERFLSDIGGTLGLWVGASVLSLAEFIEILVHLCLCCVSKH